MPKLPEVVRGAITDYRIVHRKHKTRAGRIKIYGKGGAIIEINPDMSYDLQIATLVHELLHACDEETGGGLKEREVDRISVAWVALYRRNGWKLPGQ